MPPVEARFAIPFPPDHVTLPVRPPPYVEGSDEGTKLKMMKEHFGHDNFTVLVEEGSKESRILDEWEKMYLSEEMMIRFLLAVKWNVQAAIKRLEGNLVWRRTLGLYDVEALGKEVEPEFESGKIIILGYTRQAHPVLYTWPSKNVLPPSLRQVKHMMFVVERTIDLMVAGVQGLMFCADMSGKAQTQSGVMSISRQILNNLQTQYPERLGGAGILKLPWLGSLFVTLLWPFIDSYTRNKIHVNPDLSKDLVQIDQLPVEYGGELDFEYTPEYLPNLIELCLKRRQENLSRWKAAGGKVGISEWEILPPFGSLSHGSGSPEMRIINDDATEEVTPAALTSQGSPVETIV